MSAQAILLAAAVVSLGLMCATLVLSVLSMKQHKYAKATMILAAVGVGVGLFTFGVLCYVLSHIHPGPVALIAAAPVPATFAVAPAVESVPQSVPQSVSVAPKTPPPLPAPAVVPTPAPQTMKEFCLVANQQFRAPVDMCFMPSRPK